MANIVSKVISLFVIYSIAIYYGAIVCVNILWSFCWSGFAIFKKTVRTQAPEVLEDADLGEHLYLMTKSGHKFHYVAKGDNDKPLMLCLHGFPEFWFSWRFQLKEFYDDYRVVAIDLRGYGESYRPKSMAEYKISLLGQDIQEIIEALGYSSCVLIGHDWGGIISWDFSHLYPEMVDRLVIINAPHPRLFRKLIRSSWKQFRMSWYIFFNLLPYLPELRYSLEDYGVIDELFVGEPWPYEVKEAYKYAFSRPGSLTATLNYYRCGLLYPYQQEYKRQHKRTITSPTLVVWGDKDLAIDNGVLNGLDELVENLSIKMVEGASHWVQQVNPVIVNRHIREFLKDFQNQ